jgi:hypothetical protein
MLLPALSLALRGELLGVGRFGGSLVGNGMRGFETSEITAPPPITGDEGKVKRDTDLTLSTFDAPSSSPAGASSSSSSSPSSSLGVRSSSSMGFGVALRA